MSNLNSYAQRANKIAKDAFKEYAEAAENYRKAEEKVGKYRQRRGLVNADYAAQSARAQADYLEAKNAYHNARRVLDSHRTDFEKIRRELATALEHEYLADPSNIDNNTLELLKSGILTANEYNNLLTNAREHSNFTMCRIIGKYAKDAADAIATRYGVNDPKARELREISHRSDVNNANEHLRAFDYMADTFNRTINNPRLMESWDELCGGIVENF